MDMIKAVPAPAPGHCCQCGRPYLSGEIVYQFEIREEIPWEPGRPAPEAEFIHYHDDAGCGWVPGFDPGDLPEAEHLF